MALSAPYKSGTVSAVSGVTFTAASGDSFAASDVGRLIVLTSGVGRLQHRKIVARSSNTVVTIDHAWDATPWLDTVQDVAPASGDSFAVSYIESDAAFTSESGVTSSGEQIAITALNLSGGAYLHITNSQIDLASAGMELGEGAGLILGWYQYIESQDAQVRDSCHVIDSSAGTGNNQWGRGTSPGGDFGMLDIYGGIVQVSHGGSAPFWRCYNDDADKGLCQCRWIGIQTFGSPGVGSRIDGSRSIVISEQVGAETTVGICNPRAAVSRVSITAIDCDQAAYVWLSVSGGGPSGRIVLPRISSINSKIIRVATSNHSGTNIMEVVGKKSEIDQAPVFLGVEGNPSGSHTFRYGNLINPSFIDSSNTLINESVSCVLFDVGDTVVDSRVVNGGLFGELFIRHTDIATASGSKNLSNGTQYAPYVLNCAIYGKQIVSQILSVEDYFNSNLVFLNDLSIAEPDASLVDAYTEIDTPEKFYDRAFSYLASNYSGEYQPIATRVGSEIVTEHGVVIDPDAAQAFTFDGTTITIKAAEFIGNITTTGLVSFVNGATIKGEYTDSTGTYLPDIEIIFDGIPNGLEIRLRRGSVTLDSGYESSVSGNQFAFTYPAELAGTKIKASIGGVADDGNGYDRQEIPITLPASDALIPVGINLNISYL